MMRSRDARDGDGRLQPVSEAQRLERPRRKVRGRDGKVEKSLLNFQAQHRHWAAKSSPESKHLLDQLESYRSGRVRDAERLLLLVLHI